MCRSWTRRSPPHRFRRTPPAETETVPSRMPDHVVRQFGFPFPRADDGRELRNERTGPLTGRDRSAVTDNPAILIAFFREPRFFKPRGDDQHLEAVGHADGVIAVLVRIAEHAMEDEEDPLRRLDGPIDKALQRDIARRQFHRTLADGERPASAANRAHNHQLIDDSSQRRTGSRASSWPTWPVVSSRLRQADGARFFVDSLDHVAWSGLRVEAADSTEPAEIRAGAVRHHTFSSLPRHR